MIVYIDGLCTTLGVHTKIVEIRFLLSQCRQHASPICAFKPYEDNLLPCNAIMCLHDYFDAQCLFA